MGRLEHRTMSDHGRGDGEISIARVLDVTNEQPQILVLAGSNPLPVSARALILLSPTDVGREVAVSFERGDPSRPVILGRLVTPSTEAPEAPMEVRVDDTSAQVDLTARKELTLRCGKASITLTREGKIILRGEYISSRSGGVNRIKGGSVQIN